MMSTACQPKFLPVDGSSASDILHSQFYHTPARKGKGIYSLNRCVPVRLSFCLCLSVAKISVAFFSATIYRSCLKSKDFICLGMH